jgi:serine/threonine protein kinase
MTPSRRRKVSLADYHFIARLGRGSMGEVQLARCKRTGKLYAVKIISKSRVIKTKELEHTRSERDILAEIAELSRRMRHPVMSTGLALGNVNAGPFSSTSGSSATGPSSATGANPSADSSSNTSPTEAEWKTPLSTCSGGNVAPSGTSAWSGPRSQCPFLIHMKCAFQTDTYLFLVLDYHSGGDMATLLERKIRMSEDEARFYISEIIMGVRDLHDLGVVYRDLKPENVLLGPEGKHSCGLNLFPFRRASLCIASD